MQWQGQEARAKANFICADLSQCDREGRLISINLRNYVSPSVGAMVWHEDSTVILSAAKHLDAPRQTLRGVYPERQRRAQGDKKGPSIGNNLRKSPSPSIGARVDDVALGGPSWSPVGGACFPFISLTARELPSPRATVKALPTQPRSPLRISRHPAYLHSLD